jgi:O-antigen/teichoic acid export membrane protein
LNSKLNLAKDTIVYGVGDLAGKLIAFISFPVIAGVLTPEEFGVLELLLTGAMLGGLFVGCGLNNAVQRFYWDDATTAEARPVVVTTGLLLQVGFGVAVMSALLLLAPEFGRQLREANIEAGVLALVAVAMLLPAQQWMQYMLDVTRLQFAPMRFVILSFLSRGLTAILSVWAVVVLDSSVHGVLIAQAVVSVGLLPLGIWLIRQDLVRKFDLGWARELARFGYPFIFVGGAYWVFGAMDRWMLAAMSSVEEVGIYSVAWRFAAIVTFAAMAFAQAWSPYAIKIRRDYPSEYRRIYASVLTLLLFAMLVVGGGLAMFSGELMSLLMPQEYLASAAPLGILSFGVVAQATQQVTALGLSLEKKTNLFAILACAAAIVNFFANLLLIPRLGAAGAAWATSLSYVLLTASYLYFTQRLHPLPIQWGRLTMLIVLGALVLATSLTLIATSVEWPIVIAKLGIAALCVLLTWRVMPFDHLRRV